MTYQDCVEFCYEHPEEFSTMKMNWDCLTLEMQQAIKDWESGLWQ